MGANLLCSCLVSWAALRLELLFWRGTPERPGLHTGLPSLHSYSLSCQGGTTHGAAVRGTSPACTSW